MSSSDSTATEGRALDLAARLGLCEDLFRDGRLREAFDAYVGLFEEILTERRTPRSAADLVALQRVVELSLLFGEIEAADSLLVGMIGVCDRAGNRWGADLARLQRLELTLARGWIRETLCLLGDLEPSLVELLAAGLSRRKLASWERSTDWRKLPARERRVLLARIYLVLGRLVASHGRYAEAAELVEAGLGHALAPLAPELARQTALPLHLVQARLGFEMGRFDRAEQALDLARDWMDPRRHPGFLVRGLLQEGRLHWVRGRLGDALWCLEEADGLCRRRGLRRAAIQVALDLAQTQILLNQTTAAEELLLRARDEARGLGDPVLLERVARTLRLIDLRRGSFVSGGTLSLSVFEIWQGTLDPWTDVSVPRGRELEPSVAARSFLASFEDEALEVQRALGREELEVARDLFARMQTVFGASDSPWIKARLNVLGGLLACKARQLDLAAGRLETGCRQLRALGALTELWQAQRLLGWCWTRRSHDPRALGDLAGATERLLSELTDSLGQEHQELFLLNKWTADEDYLASEIERLRQLETRRSNPWRLDGWWSWRRWGDLARLARHLDRRRAAASAAPAGAGRPRAVSRWTPIRHPRDRVTVIFSVLPDRVLVLVLGWLRWDFGVCPISRLDLRDRVARWHRLMEHQLDPGEVRAASSEGPVDARREQQSLAAELATDLQLSALFGSLPDHVRALTVVPDDCLFGVPWSALFFQGDFLPRFCSVSVQFACQRPPRTRPRPGAGSALVVRAVGDTAEASPGGGSPAALAQWFEGQGLSPRTLAGREASCQKILGALPESRLWHVTCHGSFQPDRPDLSGLWLPSERGPDLLSLEQLSVQRLDGLEHTSLVSCWGADHRSLPGRRIVGLPETLRRSGCQSVLGCLWQVDEEVASALVARFYEYSSRFERSEALRLAQLDALDGELPMRSRRSTASPFYWAGFQLYGEPGKLSFAARGSLWQRARRTWRRGWRRLTGLVFIDSGPS